MVKKEFTMIRPLKLKMENSIKENGNYTLYSPVRSKQKNKKDGVGILFWPDGTKYEGQFKEDAANGKGRKIYANGEFY